MGGQLVDVAVYGVVLEGRQLGLTDDEHASARAGRGPPHLDGRVAEDQLRQLVAGRLRRGPLGP